MSYTDMPSSHSHLAYAYVTAADYQGGMYDTLDAAAAMEQGVLRQQPRMMHEMGWIPSLLEDAEAGVFQE